jgi:hypothetical protein
MAEKNSLWKNIRNKAKQNRASGDKPKQPTTEMLRQERKIRAQKAEGGPVNTLEGDLISKVIMNRNRDKDFVQRAYAVGEYPESNMFVQPDANEFGEKNSHLMGWGEDESGQAYMFPEVMNPNNEAVRVPNQYADYISSTGYKKAAGMQYATGSFVGEDELPTYNYANKAGVIGGPRQTPRGTEVPMMADGTPVVNLPEFEIISTGVNTKPNPYSPTSLKEASKTDAWKAAKLGVDAASLYGFYPANIAGSVMDLVEGDYSGAAMGLVPVVGRAGRHGKLWKDAYTKGINAGLPHKVIFPLKKYGKQATILGSNIAQAVDSYDDLVEPYIDEVKDVVSSFNKEQKATGGYYPTQGPPKALFKGYAQGGYTNPYNQYQDDPYLQYANGGYEYGKGGRTLKNIGAGAFGVLEGLVDTTFGWIPGVDMVTDMAYKGLQKLGKSTEDEKREQDSIAGYGQAAGSVGSAILTGGATTANAISEGAQGLGKGISRGSETSEVAKGIGTGLNIAGGVVGSIYGNTEGAQAAKSAFKTTQAGSQGIGKFAAAAPIKGFSAAPKGTMEGVIDGNAVSMKPGTSPALSSVTPTKAIGTFSNTGAVSNISTPSNLDKVENVTSVLSEIPKVQEPPPMAQPLPVTPPPTIPPQINYDQFAINAPTINTGLSEIDYDFSYSPNTITFSQGGNITNNSLNLRNTMRYKRFAQGGTFDQYGINMIPDSAGLHHQSAYGGVPIGPDALAEGGEAKLQMADGGQYIVSGEVDGANTQSINGETMTQRLKKKLRPYMMGSLASNPKDKENLRRPFDSYSEGGIAQIKDNAIQETEAIRMQREGALKYAAHGGKLNKDIEKIVMEEYSAAYGGMLPNKYKGKVNMPNSYAKGGIHIKESKKGTFTAAASKHGKGVQEFAKQVLANKENYSPAMVKKANFAHNAAGWKHADGGYIHNQMIQPMLAEGGPIYGDPASEYTYAYGGMYGNPYYRGGQIDYTNDMYSSYAGGGPMPSNLPQAFDGPSAQNSNGMYLYPDGGILPIQKPLGPLDRPDNYKPSRVFEVGSKGSPGRWYELDSLDPAVRKRALEVNRENQMRQMNIMPVTHPAKAEGGMMPSEQQMMQEQQAPQEEMQQQPNQEQMMQMVQQAAQMLEQGAQPEQVMQQLVQAGVPQDMAMQAVQMAMQEMQGQMQEQPMQGQEQMMPQEGMMASGGRLPKEILRARAEAHMSSKEASNYVNNYSKGGRMYADGGEEEDPTLLRKQKSKYYDDTDVYMREKKVFDDKMSTYRGWNDFNAKMDEVIKSPNRPFNSEKSFKSYIDKTFQEVDKNNMMYNKYSTPLKGQIIKHPVGRSNFLSQTGTEPIDEPTLRLQELAALKADLSNKDVPTINSELGTFTPSTHTPKKVQLHRTNDQTQGVLPEDNPAFDYDPGYRINVGDTAGWQNVPKGEYIDPVSKEVYPSQVHYMNANSDEYDVQNVPKHVVDWTTNWLNPEKRASGGMMPPQDGMASQVAQQLKQGAQPQQVLQKLVEQGMPQEQAMAMVQAVMGQLQNQMQQQQPQQQMMPQQQMAPQQPMMAARGGYFNSRKQYDDGGFSPLADESTMSQIAGLGQSVVPALTSAFAFNKLSKRKLTPSLVEKVNIDYTPARISMMDENRRNLSAGINAMRNVAPTSGSYMGNVRGTILDANKLSGDQINKSWQDQKNEQAKYDYQTSAANAGILNQTNQSNEEMYQNAMQTGYEAAGQSVKNASAYYSDLENRNLQRWQAQNTSGENWTWTPRGKAFRNKDGIYMINGQTVDPSTGNPVEYVR